MGNVKKYVVTISLKSGTKIITQSDYNWGYDADLNNPHKKFITVGDNSINIECIESIVFELNKNYKEAEEN